MCPDVQERAASTGDQHGEGDLKGLELGVEGRGWSVHWWRSMDNLTLQLAELFQDHHYTIGNDCSY